MRVRPRHPSLRPPEQEATAMPWVGSTTYSISDSAEGHNLSYRGSNNVVIIRKKERLEAADAREHDSPTHRIRVVPRQIASDLRLPHYGVGVHLPHDVLRRATRVPRPASLRYAVLREAPIARRRVRARRRRCGIVEPLAHDDKLRERARGGHSRLGEGGGRGVWVRGQERARGRLEWGLSFSSAGKVRSVLDCGEVTARRTA